jgi:hypothetical protein
MDSSPPDRSTLEVLPFVPRGERSPMAAALPAPLASLVGREREIAAVGEALRLLTLTGPGGVGKTRLAIAAATLAANAFPDGVWFVPLAPIRDPELVVSAIACALDVRGSGDRPPLEQFAAVPREREALLLLDNFEQVAAAAPLLSHLLSTCPRLKILVTSRVVLRICGEYEYPVPPLSLPAPGNMAGQAPMLAAFGDGHRSHFRGDRAVRGGEPGVGRGGLPREPGERRARRWRGGRGRGQVPAEADAARPTRRWGRDRIRPPRDGPGCGGEDARQVW